MAPRDKADIKAKEVLQAVILAETFSPKFQPLTDLMPFVSGKCRDEEIQ